MNLQATSKMAGRTLVKHAPTILTGVGLIGVGVTAYFTYKATAKVDAYLAEHEAAVNRGEETDKVELAVGLLKHVALPVLSGVATIAAILGSHYINTRRIAAVSTMLTTAIKYHKTFQEQVRKNVGETKFTEIKKQVVEAQLATRDEDDNLVRDEDVRLSHLNGMYYEMSSEYYSDDHDYNVRALENKKEKIDDLMFRRGYILLNEVYDILGYKRTKVGAVCGWSTSSTNGVGFDWQIMNFLNSEEYFEPSIWISWNQPAYIYDQVEFEGRYAI